MQLIKIALTVGLASLGLNAQAATITTIASIDDIIVETTGSATFSFNFDDWLIADSIVNEFSPLVMDDHYEDSLGGVAYSTYSYGSSAAESEAAADFLSSSLASAEETGNAAASTISALGFDVDGIGDVSILFDVSLFAEIAGSFGSEFGDVGVSVSDSFGGFDDFTATLLGSDGDAFFSDATTLELSLTVSGFDSGFFDVTTFAVADTGVEAVPAPAAVWLFISAFGCLLGARKKRFH